ncbi:MAG: hypothetical protein ABSF32_09500 [Ignavibacteria bacterium]|jgi:hypothetical protein
MRTNIKIYYIKLIKKQSIVILICITYDLGYSTKYRFCDFYQYRVNIDFPPVFSIPPGKNLTFCEQLITFNEATEKVPGNNEIEWIEKLLKQCYGVDSKVLIKSIEDIKE